MEGSAWIISVEYKEDCAAPCYGSVSQNAKVWVNLLLLNNVYSRESGYLICSQLLFKNCRFSRDRRSVSNIVDIKGLL